MAEWEKITGYSNYEVSNAGSVKNTTTGRLLKGNVNNCGYVKISLSKDNRPKQYQLHRLVAQAFIENPDEKAFVCHEDGDNLNNNVSNLFWATPDNYDAAKIEERNKLVEELWRNMFGEIQTQDATTTVQ